MSPFAKSLLAEPQAITPTTPEELEQALAEALLCSDEPGSVTAEPLVCWSTGRPVAGVRIQLHGMQWTISAMSVLTVAGRLITSREPQVARRQALRLAWSTLSDAARTAAQHVLLARQRGAH